MAVTLDYDSDYEEQEARIERRAVDSDDDESIVDADTPMDGYFTRREHPEETYAQRTQTKEDEAVSESQASRRVLNSTRQANAPGPILDAGPAPPDYAAATADRRDRGFSADHPLVRNGLFAEERPSFESRPQQPQSMTDSRLLVPRNEVAVHATEARPVDEETGLLRGDRRDRHRRKRGRCIKCCTLSWILVVAVIGAIVLVKRINKGNSNNDGLHGIPGHQNLPWTDQPSDGLTPPHRDTAQCHFTSFSTTEAYNLSNPRDFTIRENIQQSASELLFPLSQPLILGTVKVLPMHAEDSDGPDVTVLVNIATTSQIRVFQSRVFFTKTPGAEKLELLFPDLSLMQLDSRQTHCLDFAVTILVRSGTKLGNWIADLKHLKFEAPEDLFSTDSVQGNRTLYIDKDSAIKTSSGSISVKSWSGRKTYLETHSGSIDGTYALRDLLVARTNSGTINLSVEPQEADPEHPAPATLQITSSSGATNVDVLQSSTFTSTDKLPLRDYHTEVSTRSASISGHFLIGASATFTSRDGRIDIGLLPFPGNLSNSTLQTKTNSGSTSINIPSLSQPNAPVIDGLQSSHTSRAGSLHLHYPDEWEGKIEGESRSGTIDVRGPGIMGLPLPSIPYTESSRFVAQKGRGHSRLGFETRSGSVTVRVG